MQTIATAPPTAAAAARAGHRRFDCLAVLETTVTRACALQIDGVQIDEQAGGRSACLIQSPRGLAAILPGELESDERTLIDDEIAAFVSEHDRGPFVLERLIDRGAGHHVHVHICVLPLDTDEHADIAELLADEGDPDLARALVEQYGAEIADKCAQCLPDGRLPVAFLEDFAPQGRQRALPLPVNA